MKMRHWTKPTRSDLLSYVHDTRNNAVKGAPPGTGTGTNPNPKVMEEIEILQKQYELLVKRHTISWGNWGIILFWRWSDLSSGNEFESIDIWLFREVFEEKICAFFCHECVLHTSVSGRWWWRAGSVAICSSLYFGEYVSFPAQVGDGERKGTDWFGRERRRQWET